MLLLGGVGEEGWEGAGSSKTFAPRKGGVGVGIKDPGVAKFLLRHLVIRKKDSSPSTISIWLTWCTHFDSWSACLAVSRELSVLDEDLVLQLLCVRVIRKTFVLIAADYLLLATILSWVGYLW